MEQAAAAQQRQQQQSPGLFKAQGFLPLDSLGRIDAAQQCRSVSLCFCDTEAEQQAAQQLSAVWKDVHITSQQQSEGGWQAAARYAEEEEILQRLRSTVTLAQLRSLLAELRDIGELARLADSSAAAAAASQLAGGAGNALAGGRRAISGPAAAAVRRAAVQAGAQRAQVAEPSDTEGEEEEGEGGFSSLSQQHMQRGVYKLQAFVNLPLDSNRGLLSTAPSKHVRVLYCATPEEQAVATEVAYVWRELLLGGSEAGRSHNRKEVMLRYQEEQQLLQRLQGVSTLAQLRSLLRELRDSKELERLAGRTGTVTAAAAGQQQQQQQQQQPQQGRYNIKLHVKADAGGVPDGSQPSKQWFLIEVSTPAEAALARDLASAWRAAHGKGVPENYLMQGQEAQQRLSRALPALLHQVLDASTVPHLQECLRGLKNSGELRRAAGRLNLGGTAAGAVGAQLGTAQKAAAVRLADAETPPATERERGSNSNQPLPRKRTGASIAAEVKGAPSRRRAAAGGSSRQAPSLPLAAAAAGLGGDGAGVAAAPAEAAAGRQAAPQQQRQSQQQEQQQQLQRDRFFIKLRAKANAGGVPDASQPSKQWTLIEVSSPAEAALVRDLGTAWRAAHGKGVQEESLLQGQKVQQRLSRALPALMRQVLDASTILQLRGCFRGLRDNGELNRAAAQLELGGMVDAVGAQAAAPRPASVVTPGVEHERGGNSARLVSRKRAGVSAAGAEGRSAPSSKRAAAGGGRQARLGAPAAAAAGVSGEAVEGVGGGRQGVAAAPAEAAAGRQAAPRQQRHKQQRQRQQEQTRQQRQQQEQRQQPLTGHARPAAGAGVAAAAGAQVPSLSSHPGAQPAAAAPAARQPPSAQQQLPAPAAAPAAAAPHDPVASTGAQNGSMPQRLLAACNDEHAQAAGLTHEVVSGYLAVLMGRCSEAQRQEVAEWVGPLLSMCKFEAVRVFMEGLVKAHGL